MGAWIETVRRQVSPSALWSHPTWVRGLKLLCCSRSKPKA